MRVQPECLPCILNRVLFEVNMVNPEKADIIMPKVLRVLCESYPSDIRSAKVWTKIHEIVYSELGEDPYKDLKKRSNRIAMEIYPKASEIYLQSDDKLRTAALISIAGNVLDFGISGGVAQPEIFEKKFMDIVNEGLGYDDTGKLEKYLKNGVEVIYLADNCGEIVLDKIMVEELKRRGCRVTLVVRGEPIISDATLEDAEYVSITKVVDEVTTTGIFAIGVDLDRIPESLKRKLEDADIIIAKGMANYESIGYDLRPIAYLMRAKCKPVARSLGVPFNKNVVKVIE